MTLHATPATPAGSPHDALPARPIDPAAFALVGMGGFFAGVSKTPLASMILVCEITGSYNLLVPLMLVCGLHVALSGGWTLYEEQVPGPHDRIDRRRGRLQYARRAGYRCALDQLRSGAETGR